MSHHVDDARWAYQLAQKKADDLWNAYVTAWEAAHPRQKHTSSAPLRDAFTEEEAQRQNWEYITGYRAWEREQE